MKTNRLRQIAKRIPALYWLAGLLAYLRFQLRLKQANNIYARQSRPRSPPPTLRYRVHGALDEASYLNVADLTAATLAKRLASHGVALEGLTILDFGSGPGRVTNELKKLSNACRFFGSDIDKEAIEWARANLHDTATFDVNAALPPTKHASGFFDVVYSVSVFTHLDEATQEAWLKELARITKPGGTLIVSTHGARTLASCTPRELEALNTRGFEFRIGRKGSFKLDGLPDFYQTTFHTKDYVARVWSKYLEVVDHIEGGLLEHQDLVVLRRRTNVA